MDDINDLLEKLGLASMKDAGIAVVSIFGVSEQNNYNRYAANSVVSLANNIVGRNVFSSHNECLKEGTIELIDGLQCHVDQNTKTAYLFMDSAFSEVTAHAEKFSSSTVINHQSKVTRTLFLMFLVSHLVLPIIPPGILPVEFLSTLVLLNQTKSLVYTHLAQYQASCWKYWDVPTPYHLFEKKENDRSSPAYTGWWGPAKGVPILVFIAANLQFKDIIPASIKKMQEIIQNRVKNVFRAMQLIPDNSSRSDRGRGGGQSFRHYHQPPPPIDVKSLFLLPSGTQPIIHIVPAPTDEILQEETIEYTFDEIQPLSYYADLLEKPQHSPSAELYHDYSEKLLKNYVTIWIKAATLRHPLHTNQQGNTSNRKNNSAGDIPKSTPLPSALHFVSALVPLLSFLFGRSMLQDGKDFNKKIIGVDNPSTKGMIQQIEVILRKKIKDYVEIENVFSKSHSLKTMQKCLEIYAQDSPPFYPERYHILKRNHVLRLYHSISRGPCALDYGNKLERECDNIWKGGRQSCECISLTEKNCRLKLGHENEAVQQKVRRDDRAALVDPTKHNSGFTLFHACNCGQSQHMREDPFDLIDANVRFYSKFSCCLNSDRAAVDIEKSTFGDQQNLVLNSEELPVGDTVLLYLGPSNVYKNNVGLDKVSGFMSNTNFLIPWSVTTVDEIKLRKQQQQEETVALDAVEKAKVEVTANDSKREDTEKVIKTHETEWPALGQEQPLQASTTAMAAPIVVPSFEAFPALGTDPVAITTPASTKDHQLSTAIARPAEAGNKQLQDTQSSQSSRRRRFRSRERLQGLIRGYVGAEYECSQGHRFLSCGQGRVCKLGHADHPKEHGNYFVHQDLPIHVICPCTYANAGATTNSTSQGNTLVEVTAQLQRLYVVTPEEAITISIEPKLTIFTEESEAPLELDLGIKECISLGPNSMYVLRLPFIYKDSHGRPIPMSMDVQKRLKSAVLQKNCFKFHYKDAKKWELPTVNS